MPHVSRHTPVRRVSDNIFEKLLEWATSKGAAQKRKRFLADLLTPTERIMLSKRFAIVYMLQKGYSFDSIQEILRVSPSTVARVWSALEKGRYAGVIQQMRTPKFESNIADFLLDLLPPMNMSKKQYAERMRRLNVYR